MDKNFYKTIFGFIPFSLLFFLFGSSSVFAVRTIHDVPAPPSEYLEPFYCECPSGVSDITCGKTFSLPVMTGSTIVSRDYVTLNLCREKLGADVALGLLFGSTDATYKYLQGIPSASWDYPVGASCIGVARYRDSTGWQPINQPSYGCKNTHESGLYLFASDSHTSMQTGCYNDLTDYIKTTIPIYLFNKGSTDLTISKVGCPSITIPRSSTSVYNINTPLWDPHSAGSGGGGSGGGSWGSDEDIPGWQPSIIQPISGDWGSFDFLREGFNVLIEAFNQGFYWLSDFFKSISDWFVEGLQNLFVPEEGYFSEFGEQISTAFNEKINVQGFKNMLDSLKNAFINNNIEMPADITVTIFGRTSTILSFSLIDNSIGTIRTILSSLLGVVFFIVIIPKFISKLTAV